MFRASGGQVVQAALFPASDHEWLIDFRPNDSRSLTTNQMADLLGSDRYQGLLILLPKNDAEYFKEFFSCCEVGEQAL